MFHPESLFAKVAGSLSEGGDDSGWDGFDVKEPHRHHSNTQSASNQACYKPETQINLRCHEFFHTHKTLADEDMSFVYAYLENVRGLQLFFENYCNIFQYMDKVSVISPIFNMGF